jgi:hypothetical protein
VRDPENGSAADTHPAAETLVFPAGLALNPTRHELTNTFELHPDVRVHLNAPADLADAPRRPVKLVIYALPNGNSIENAAGRRPASTNDWRFDNQHIAAQTRFLRERAGETNLVMAYFEARQKSWPAWRKQHDPRNQVIPALIRQVKDRFAGRQVKLSLTGHSGGGSFIFGYLGAFERIPDEVERIAFLDATYGYDPALGHTEKLAGWLKESPEHTLVVLAYDDFAARLNGKPFVSATGGTGFRSHLMVTNLAPMISLSHSADGPMERYVALDGRLQLLLRANPEARIWHTVMVELNGLIHCLLAGTPGDSRGYQYLRPRAYAQYIDP